MESTLGDVMVYNQNPEIVNFEILKTTFEVTYRIKSNATFACNPPKPVPDSIYKIIYGFIDGEIVEIERINGIHTPGHYIKGTFEFNE